LGDATFISLIGEELGSSSDFVVVIWEFPGVGEVGDDKGH